jgi:hypothetical protein
MSERKSNEPTTSSSELTSAGVPWAEVPDFALPDVEWIDGRHGPAGKLLPSISEVPVPEVLLRVPRLHPDRPRGSKPMADASGAKLRLADCRPRAWLISPFTGWWWAKRPDGEIGWLPSDTVLPDRLRVWSRNDIQ